VRTAEFLEFSRRYGGPFSEEVIEDPWTRKILAGEEAKCVTMTEGWEFSVDIGIVADSRANALAAISNGRPLVFVFQGLVSKVYEACAAVAPRITGSPSETPFLIGALAEAALLYVKLHELAHLGRGHIGLLGEGAANSVLEERGHPTPV
jgi:hypothetical protein